MAAYILAITLSGVLGWLASQAKDRYTRLVLGIVAILPYCLVAGLRANSVGTDTLNYPYQIFIAAKYSSLSEYMSSTVVGNVEVLFSALSWVTTKLFGDFNVNLFIYQALVVAPLLFCLIRICPLQLGLGLIAYGLLYFPFTLNVVRQTISAGFLLVAFVYALESKYLWYALFIAISVGFHNTGALGLIIVPVVEVLRRIDDSENPAARRRYAEIFILCVCTGVCVLAALIVFGGQWLYLLQLIKSSYWVQASDLGEQKPILSIAVLCIIYTAMYALTFKSSRIDRASFRLNSALTLFLIGGALCQLAILGTHMNRVGRGLLLFVVLFPPLLIAETERKNRVLSYIVLVGMAAFYFLYVYIYTREGGAYPYSSNIFPLLGIA